MSSRRVAALVVVALALLLLIIPTIAVGLAIWLL
jgi:hypothetical protein